MTNNNEVIRVWAGGDSVELVGEAIKSYREEGGYGIDFQIGSMSLSEIDHAIESGSIGSSDIVLLNGEMIQRCYKKFSSYLVSFNEYMDHYGIRAEDFIPYSIANVTSEEGQVYAIPYSGEPAVLYYRENLLNEEKFSVNDLDTWAGFHQVMRRLKEKGQLTPLAVFDLQIFLRAMGSHYLDKDGNINASGIQEAMTQLKELYDEGLAYLQFYMDSIRDSLRARIMQGTSAFIGSFGMYSTLKEISKEEGIEDWCITRLPKSDVFVNDVGLDGCSWVVMDGEGSDISIDFLLKTFVKNTDFALDLAKKYNIVPVYQEALEVLQGADDFEDKQILQLAAELEAEIPENPQKIFILELESCFKYWFNEVIYHQFPIEKIEDKFIEIWDYLQALAPNKYYETLLSKIIISKAPNKTTYIEGETFDCTGMEVSAEYFNQPGGVITDYTYLPTGPLSAGLQRITISYTIGDITQKTYIDCRVKSKSISGLKIEKMPDKIKYIERESFDRTGMKVKAFYNNGNSELVENYAYSPKSKLTMESSKITVSGVRGGGTATVTFPITMLERSPLKGITILTPPEKTLYKEGEIFEAKGMVVRAEYTDDASMIIDDYTITSNKLSFLDKKVTVSYTEKGITKTAEVRITVLKNVDLSKQNQTELKYGCEAGVASVNLFNQRLLFEHPDVSIGANTYEISVSHVYNSFFDERISLGDGKSYLRTGMGKGFKLNVQQYVIPSGKNYLYIDEVGHRHTFEGLEDGTSYYDTSGLGLILTVKTYEKVIGDDFGNKMVFDTSGRLVKTVSGFNAGMVKTFIYNAKGQLEEIYDNRNKSNAITLEYDQTTGLLKTMSCKQGGVMKRSISYVYKKVTDFMLVDIIDERGDTSFAYDSESLQMTYAVSKLDKSALKFTYSNGAIMEVNTGVIDNETSVVGTAQISSAKLSMSAENVQSKNTFAFNKASTVVTNEKNIQLLYSFNADGVTTSILEANDINDLRTLEKQPGVRIMIGGSSSEKINNQNVYEVISNEVLSTDNVITLSEVIPYRKTKCPDYKHYICSFWLKLSKATSENCEAKITVESKTDFVGDYMEEGHMTIDNTAVNSWQLVAIPIQISGNNIKAIKMELSGTNNYKMGDMRLYYSPLVRFCIGHREDSLPLDEITQIKFMRSGATSYTTMTINQNCYMTEKDLQATYLSKYNGCGYTLSLCDNTEKHLVREVKLCKPGKEFTLELDDKGRAQFYQETKSPDGGVRIYGELYFNKDADGTAFSGICQYTEAVKDTTKSSTSIYVDYKGKVRKERDEYGTETVYEYDADGVLCKKIIQHPEANEKLVYEITTTAEKTTEKSAISHRETSYDFFGNVDTVKYNGSMGTASNMLTTTFHYDNSKGRLDSVENDLGGQNSLKYNENGRLSEVAPTSFQWEDDYGYEFEYNKFGEPVKYSLLYGSNKVKQILASKEINYINGTVKDKKYRQAENRADETVVSMDEYGRTKEISEKSYGGSEKISRFTRQELWESAGASEVSNMYDAYEGRTYEYSYDDRNNCTGYNVTVGDINGSAYFSIHKTGENKVAYNLHDHFPDWESEIIYESDKLLNPRIAKTSSMIWEDRDNGNTTYQYDKLGRINHKEHRVYERPAGHLAEITKDITYKFGTTLKETLTTKLLDGKYIVDPYEQSYEYNNRGLLIKDTCKRKYSVENPETLQWEDLEETKQKVYTYDKANRLKTESTPTGTIEYSYRADGSIGGERRNGIDKLYSYYQGRLTGFRNGNESFRTEFGYDNLGNCTHYKRSDTAAANMEWERGSLLKRYTTAGRDGHTEAKYYYNSQGIRFKKEVGGEETNYYLDGGKLIMEKKGYRLMRFTYDQEGILGVEVVYDDIDHYQEGGLYHYVKDGSGNVIALMDSYNAVALYEYDAWGNTKVLNPDGTENTDSNFVGNVNPIRWKSQYYDVESELYYIGGRYYSPLMKRYISASNPETVLGKAADIYGLNPYLLSLTNPVELVYNGYTIEPNGELVYDPDRLSGWDVFVRGWNTFWRSSLGKGLSIGLFVAATLLLLIIPGTRSVGLYIGAVAGAGATLCMGGAISGWSRKKNSGEFWEGFACYINENWSQTVAISMATALVTFGIRHTVAAIKNAAANKALANAAVAARDAKVAELRNTLSRKDLKNIAAVVGGYNKTTGQVAVGVKKFDRLPYCAEALVVEQLGGMQSIDDIVMTSAIRPSNLSIVPVCEYCQSIYTVKNFLPGTPFKPL